MAGTGSVDEIVRSELVREAPEAARRLAETLLDRYGDAVQAILFYGSCLRRSTSEGVLDFYMIVDDYRSTYGSGLLAAVNALLPPNVFYLEQPGPGDTLRAKVAVLSARDFARGTGPGSLRPGFWARFCQPVVAVHLRDEAARDVVAESAVQAIHTAVTRGLGLVPSRDGAACFSSRELWLAVFRETYASELRTESDDSVTGLYAADPARYDRVLAAALAGLAADGRARIARDGDAFRVSRASQLLDRPRRGRRIAAKLIGAVQLVKSAFTFGDWVPYALWKLERHTGTRLELTERQRRHPFLFAWPVFFRVLGRRELR